MLKKFRAASLLGIWLVIAAICIACIFIGIGNAGLMSSIILATLLVLPVRNWISRLIVWGIQYLFSINPSIKKKFGPYVVVDNLDPTGDKKVLDKGALNIINWSVGGICILIAVFFLAFQGISKEVVYNFIHNAYIFLEYFVDGMGYIPFIWVIASAISIFLTIFAIKDCVKGNAGIKDVIFLAYIVVKHIANYFVFQYTIGMVIGDIIGLIIFFGLIALVAFIIYKKVR